MTITQAVVAYLNSKSTITDLVGTRISNVRRPQKDTLPAITVRRVGALHEHNLDGAAGSCVASIQLDCWATTNAAAETIGEAVRLVMDGFVGTMGDKAVAVCTFEFEIDLYDEPRDASDVGVYHVAQDYAIRYTESIPTF